MDENSESFLYPLKLKIPIQHSEISIGFFAESSERSTIKFIDMLYSNMDALIEQLKWGMHQRLGDFYLELSSDNVYLNGRKQCRVTSRDNEFVYAEGFVTHKSLVYDLDEIATEREERIAPIIRV